MATQNPTEWLEPIQLEWQDCLLPKPTLEPPRLLHFLEPWLVVDWDGNTLERFPKPSEAQLCSVIKQLTLRYPQIQLPNAILDLMLDLD